MQMKHMLICPKCKRLWLFWDGFNNKPTEYVIDRTFASRCLALLKSLVPVRRNHDHEQKS